MKEGKIDFKSGREAVKAVEESRKVKEKAKSNNVNIQHSYWHPEHFPIAEELVDRALIELLQENKAWIDEQKSELSELVHTLTGEEVSKNSIEKIHFYFEEGLMSFLKQQYALENKGLNKNQKNIPAKFRDKEYIRQQIIAYTFDFIELMKLALKEGSSLPEAVKIAKLAYLQNPDIFERLNKKYPNLKSVIIRRAIFSRPRDPDGCVEDYISGKIPYSYGVYKDN